MSFVVVSTTTGRFGGFGARARRGLGALSLKGVHSFIWA